VGLRRAPLRFAGEAAFLVAVGAALAAADVELLPFVVVMAAAWVLVATAERMVSRAGVALPSVTRRARREGREPPSVPQPRVPAPAVRRPAPEPPEERREPARQRTVEAKPEPEPEPEGEPEPEEEEEPAQVVPALPQAAHRRPDGWNLWDLELRAQQLAGDRLRDEEWHALFVSLREYAHPDGSLPSEFDALVQESFGELISRRA
jgi:hypothetical protein